MKNYYLFLVLLVSFNFYGQSNCEEANSYLVIAYSHVKDAYDSNNISHLQYYANRSLESFKLSKKTLTTCGCEPALKLANKAIDLLAKVDDTETYEDGRFFVKRARDISKESVIEIDKCSMANYVPQEDNYSESDKLSELQKEQLKLKQQQDALKLREAEIKTKLAEQKEQQLTIEKKQLILAFESAIASHIKTYNETLKICDCNHDILKQNDTSEGLLTKSIEDIKTHYNNILKTLTSNYLAQLNLCNN
jgi:hypothetical protein